MVSRSKVRGPSRCPQLYQYNKVGASELMIEQRIYLSISLLSSSHLSACYARLGLSIWFRVVRV